MNIASRRNRVLAVLLGIALLVVVVVQVRRDGRQLNFKTTDIQIKKR